MRVHSLLYHQDASTNDWRRGGGGGGDHGPSFQTHLFSFRLQTGHGPTVCVSCILQPLLLLLLLSLSLSFSTSSSSFPRLFLVTSRLLSRLSLSCISPSTLFLVQPNHRRDARMVMNYTFPVLYFPISIHFQSQIIHRCWSYNNCD